MKAGIKARWIEEQEREGVWELFTELFVDELAKVISKLVIYIHMKNLLKVKEATK